MTMMNIKLFYFATLLLAMFYYEWNANFFFLCRLTFLFILLLLYLCRSKNLILQERKNIVSVNKKNVQLHISRSDAKLVYDNDKEDFRWMR